MEGSKDFLYQDFGMFLIGLTIRASNWSTFLGQPSVSGRNLLPKPAASIRALMLDLITLTRKTCGDLEKVYQIISDNLFFALMNRSPRRFFSG